MKEYYIVSLKHTSKGDTALLFWAENSCGYTRDRNRAGIYTEESAMQRKDDENVPVLKEDADKFWMNALDFKDKYVSIPNNPTVLNHLGLQSEFMKPKKYAGCRMVFINTPLEITP